MKKKLLVALSVLTIVGAIEFADRAFTARAGGPMPLCPFSRPNCDNVQNAPMILADGSDPMPLCRHGKPNCPNVVKK